MREIKLRAWHKAKQRMYPVRTLYLDAKEKQVELQGISAVYAFTIGEDVELIQFTGLVDKGGKDIYEGDIVKGVFTAYKKNGDAFLREEIAVVSYDKNRQLLPFHTIVDYDANLWMDSVVGGFEVIGNIYETPELTK